eukprot:325764_1
MTDQYLIHTKSEQQPFEDGNECHVVWDFQNAGIGKKYNLKQTLQKIEESIKKKLGNDKQWIFKYNTYVGQNEAVDGVSRLEKAGVSPKTVDCRKPEAVDKRIIFKIMDLLFRQLHTKTTCNLVLILLDSDYYHLLSNISKYPYNQ